MAAHACYSDTREANLAYKVDSRQTTESKVKGKKKEGEEKEGRKKGKKRAGEGEGKRTKRNVGDAAGGRPF